MSLYAFNIISTYSLVVVAVMLAFRYRRIPKNYRPFCYYVWLGLVNEIITGIEIRRGQSNFASGNVYVLIEFFAILWFFSERNVHQRNSRVAFLLGVVTLIVWITDNLLLHSISRVNTLYRTWYSFVLVYLSIDQLNYVLITGREKVVFEPMFIICVGMLIFFCYKGFYELYCLSDLRFSQFFHQRLFSIYLVINLTSNLLYCLATFWIPRRQQFSIPY